MIFKAFASLLAKFSEVNDNQGCFGPITGLWESTSQDQNCTIHIVTSLRLDRLQYMSVPETHVSKLTS